MQDAAKKGRVFIQDLAGEDNGQAKLTTVSVLEIRRRYTPGYGHLTELAREFGVKKSAIWMIVNRRSWKHI